MLLCFPGSAGGSRPLVVAGFRSAASRDKQLNTLRTTVVGIMKAMRGNRQNAYPKGRKSDLIPARITHYG